jgi:hypothetical protein
MMQAEPMQMNPRVDTMADSAGYKPLGSDRRHPEARPYAPRETKKKSKPGIRLVALLLLLAALGFGYSVIRESRKAAGEALAMRQRAHEQQNQAFMAQQEAMRKFNEALNAASLEEPQGRSLQESDPSVAAKPMNGDYSTITALDSDMGATEEVLAEVGRSMPLYENGTPQSNQIAQTARAPWMQKPVSEWPQVLLTNEITFKGHTGMFGGSSFVVTVDDGSYWLITAERIISEEAGVEPPLFAEDLDGVLHQWKAFPPRSPQTFIMAKGLARGMSSETCGGTLAVRLHPSSVEGLPVKALRISKRKAVEGDVLYLFGLPFYDKLHPQNVYTCRVNHVDPSLGSFRVALSAEVMTRRFSGAPLINADGEVAGIFLNGFGQASSEVAEATIVESFIGR